MQFLRRIRDPLLQRKYFRIAINMPTEPNAIPKHPGTRSQISTELSEVAPIIFSSIQVVAIVMTTKLNNPIKIPPIVRLNFINYAHWKNSHLGLIAENVPHTPFAVMLLLLSASTVLYRSPKGRHSGNALSGSRVKDGSR